MMRRILSLALLCSCIFIFCSCSTVPGSDKSSVLQATVSKFSDIPVPVGLKALPEASYSFQSSGVRVGVLKYRGKGDADQIINFYKEQMPMYNWNLLNVVEYGERMLNFDRETETCVVRLSGSGNKVVITISLGPKSQASKKAAKPIK